MADRSSEIRNILIVLSTAVATAGMMAAFFVLNFGPSGGYVLDSVLIEPAVLQHLNYNDANPRIGHSDRYIFDKIIWLDRGISGKEVDFAAFEKLYAFLKPDKSMNDPEVERFFLAGINPKVVVWVRTDSPSSWQRDSKIFQEIEFQKDYYRVSLHAASPKIPFAYFYHPDILQSAQNMLNE
jgi:hypothetical protein